MYLNPLGALPLPDLYSNGNINNNSEKWEFSDPRADNDQAAKLPGKSMMAEGNGSIHDET